MSAQAYHERQIVLHWLVVGLVAFQFLTGEGMARAFANGLPADASGGAAIVHGTLGTFILLAMLGRVATRYRHGAPPPPESESDAIQKVSRGNHVAFYVVLFRGFGVGRDAGPGVGRVDAADLCPDRSPLVIVAHHRRLRLTRGRMRGGG